MSLKSEGLTLRQRIDRLLAQEAVARSTHTAPKASISKETTMNDKPKKPEPLPAVEFDAGKVNQLLDVIEGTKDSPGFLPFNRAAVCGLDDMKPDIEEKLEKRDEEVKKRAAEAEAEKVKKLEEHRKAREEEEKKEKAA